MFLIGDCREVVYEDFWECRAGSQGTVQPQAKKEYVVIAGYLSNHLTFFCVLCLTTCVIHNHARCAPSASWVSLVLIFAGNFQGGAWQGQPKMHALWVTLFATTAHGTKYVKLVVSPLLFHFHNPTTFQCSLISVFLLCTQQASPSYFFSLSIG
jgi:hypothetical protein